MCSAEGVWDIFNYDELSVLQIGIGILMFKAGAEQG
jgi:hypothetical protein